MALLPLLTSREFTRSCVAVVMLSMSRYLTDGIGKTRSAVITGSHVVVNRKEGILLLDRQTLAVQGSLGSPGRGIREALALDDGSIAIASDGQDSTLLRWSPDQPERLVTVGPAPYHFGTRAGRLVGLVGRGDCATAEVIGEGSRREGTTVLWKVCASDRLHVGRFGRHPRPQTS